MLAYIGSVFMANKRSTCNLTRRLALLNPVISSLLTAERPTFASSQSSKITRYFEPSDLSVLARCESRKKEGNSTPDTFPSASLRIPFVS